MRIRTTVPAGFVLLAAQSSPFHLQLPRRPSPVPDVMARSVPAKLPKCRISTASDRNIMSRKLGAFLSVVGKLASKITV